jgi:protein FAM32A
VTGLHESKHFRLATLASYPIQWLFASGGSSELPTDPNNELIEADKIGDEEGNPHPDYDHLTPAERRYMEQKQKIDMQKLAKVANKSHRDRIQDFNQYLANLSEHYDIPKVGPG